MNIIILAAGKGSRFYPITKTIPKAMVPLKNGPLIEYVIKPFIPHVSKIICIVNPDTGDVLKNFLGSNYLGKPVIYGLQHNEDNKGTWPSMLHGLPYLSQNDEHFCVINCDDLYAPSDINELFSSKELIPGIGISYTEMPKNYLSIKTKEDEIIGFERNIDKEQNLITDWYSNGFHILPKKVFSLEGVGIGGEEYGLPQTLFRNLDIIPLKAYRLKNWQSVNGPEDLESAEKFIETHY